MLALEIAVIAAVACLSGLVSYRLLRSSGVPSTSEATNDPDHEDAMREVRRLRSESAGFARDAQRRTQEDWTSMYDRKGRSKR